MTPCQNIVEPANHAALYSLQSSTTCPRKGIGISTGVQKPQGQAQSKLKYFSTQNRN